MFRQILVIAMAYFGVTVGAGFASGQEVLQYYVSYGIWGIAGGVLVLVVMPLAAMIILQYGSYFRAQSHGKVFDSVASKVTAKFLDWSLMIAQFCVGFVMMAGAGSNLNQQFGLPLWVGSTIMLVGVLIAGMLDVDKVTGVLGVFTPFMVIILLIAGFYALSQAPASIDDINAYAIAEVDSPLPNWWMSTANYVGLCMFSGISMSIIIGGSNWNPRWAGWGGLVGGFIFAGLLVLLTFGILFRVETVGDSALPTLALINEINPVFGSISAIVIYLMIFATTLGVFYASGRRFAASGEDGTVDFKKYRIVFVVLVLVGYALSFFDFALLVNNVFPIIGWLGVVLIIVLVVTWYTRFRNRIRSEAERRAKVVDLVTKKLDPEEEFTPDDYAELVHHTQAASIPADSLRDDVTEYVIEQLDADEEINFSADDIDRDEIWADARFRKLMPGEVRVVSSADPVARKQEWVAEEYDESWNLPVDEAEEAEEDSTDADVDADETRER